MNIFADESNKITKTDDLDYKWSDEVFFGDTHHVDSIGNMKDTVIPNEEGKKGIAEKKKKEKQKKVAHTDVSTTPSHYRVPCIFFRSLYKCIFCSNCSVVFKPTEY